MACIIVTAVCFQSFLTSVFVLETCARAEVLAGIKEGPKRALPTSTSMVCIQHRKFELSLLTKTFLGNRWSIFFTGTTALDLYGITWVFCSVFASAFADQLPIQGVDSDYRFYVAVFAMVAVPLSCTQLPDQLFVQMTFLVARMVMLLLMVTTIVAAFIDSEASHFGEQLGPANALPLADFSNTVEAVQIAIFSTAFQFSVPILGGVTKSKPKLADIIRNATCFIYLSNIFLGLLVAFYLGDSCEPSNNLNWLHYHGGKISSSGESRSFLTKMISHYIVLFAAADGLAVFPLIIISLGDILMGAVFGDNVHAAEKNWKIRALFRLLASLPQVVGAMFIQDLGALATYAGIFTLLSYTACPSLLALSSSRQMKEKGYSPETCYSLSYFTSPVVAYLLLFAVFVIIAGVLLESIFS